MRRVLVLLLALAFLPTLCRAGSIDVTNYQVDVSGKFVEANPSCVSNCTETISVGYEFESNLDVFNPTSPTNGIYGWVVTSTIQVTSSGFLGSFSPASFISGLWAHNGPQYSLGFPFVNSLGDEIDLANPGPGLSNTGPATLLIYDCVSTRECANAYPGNPSSYIFANSTTATVVPMPESSPAWQFLLISASACTVGLFVKHRLGLTPSRWPANKKRA